MTPNTMTMMTPITRSSARDGIQFIDTLRFLERASMRLGAQDLVSSIFGREAGSWKLTSGRLFDNDRSSQHVHSADESDFPGLRRDELDVYALIERQLPTDVQTRKRYGRAAGLVRCSDER